MKGIGVSPGIAIGRAQVLKKQEILVTGIGLRSEEEVQQEIKKFEDAVKAAVGEVEALKATLPDDDPGLDILEIQTELLQDEQIGVDVTKKITIEKRCANDAVIEVIEIARDVFQNMNDEYFSAREADVQDAGNRILRHLNGSLQGLAQSLWAGRTERSFSGGAQITGENTIIIAEDITPSDTLIMDTARVSGFATQTGSKTSHAAIIARAKGIPAVVGCGAGLEVIRTNDLVIVDGLEGVILVQPSQTMIDEYAARKMAFAKQVALLNDLKDVEARTTDGVKITLLANISGVAEMEASFLSGGEGSGLLRTEMLFMGRNALPGEEEQFEFYKSIAIKAKGRPVTVRSLDIGGDKQLPYLNLPAEPNPFLGYRAIRISLDQKEIFITQLRAILRASQFGQLKIMLPMISNVQEVRQARAILEEVKTDLSSAGIAFDRGIPLGIMIEIPSAAVTADILAREVDFFSIGTNDLCQYTLAVDRMNERVKHLYDPFNPGVLRLIQQVIVQGDKHHIHTGMCGELAGDVQATLLLLGMGLKEFSMSVSSIPYVKNIIIHNSMATAREICQRVMAMDSSETILDYLQEAMQS
ncbi:MAG TPA: phosphoenolpyruvate--protein phosphotransferase [Puia sp.]|nr:phosphoenolpyruvate--protein phosphotransferase [Puia sp.]